MTTPWIKIAGLVAILAFSACTKPTKPAAEATQEAAAPVAAEVAAPAVAAPVSVFTDANRVAIHGYDPVAYFTVGAPTPGSASFTSDVNGAIYQFASAENKALFDADPAKYEPAYGGFCAYGASVGKKFETSPDAFKIQGGKLYLNKDKNIQKEWEKDVPGNITKADANWPGIAEGPRG